MRSSRRARRAAVLPAVLLLAGCGSTAQVRGEAVTVGDGLAPVTATTTGSGSPAVVPGAGQPLPAGVPGPGQAGQPGTGASGPTLPTATATAPTTAVTTPISVGLLDTGDTSSFTSAYGFSSSSSLTGQGVMKALVAWYNKHGGIARRHINVVEYTASATAASYDTEYSAACARFTQDNHVAVVLTQTGYQTSANYETCLSKAGVPNISGGLGGYDEQTLASHPLLFPVNAASVDRSLVAELRGLTGNGFLTPKNVLGVIVEDCPWNTAAYDRTFAPLAKQLGLQVTRRDVSCVDGNGTIPQTISQVDAAVLPFRSAGVDRVTFVSSYQGSMVVFFEQQASSQGYKPQYAVTSFSTAGAYASYLSADGQQRLQGVGWAPDADVGVPGPPKGATKRCRTMLAEERVVPASTGEAYAVDGICAQFFALEDALTVTRGRSDAASLRAGLEAGGPSSFLLGGARRRTAAVHDPAPLFATFARDSRCGCFAYTGAPRAWAG